MRPNSMEGLLLRQMREEDLEEVYKINASSFTTDAWSMDAFKREFRLPYSRRFVMERNGKVVAYVIYWVIKEEATVMTFAVRTDLRGKGIGKRLLMESIKLLRGEAGKVVLDVRKSNIRAIRLYKRLGFEVVCERERFYSDGESALLMSLSVDKIDGGHGDKGTEALLAD